MKTYRLEMRLGYGGTYTLREAAQQDFLTDEWIDELSDLHVGQRWLDPDGDWWERIA